MSTIVAHHCSAVVRDVECSDMLGRNLSALVTKMVRFVTEKAVAIEVLVDGSEPKLAAMFVSYLTHVARPLANSIDFIRIGPIDPRNQNRYVGESAHLKTGVRLSHQTCRRLGPSFLTGLPTTLAQLRWFLLTWGTVPLAEAAFAVLRIRNEIRWQSSLCVFPVQNP